VSRFRPRWIALALLPLPAAIAAVAAFGGPPRSADDRFGHERHGRLFPECTTCHLGMTETGASVWPDPQACANCHDGTVEERIEWAPRSEPRASNLRFEHLAHAREALERNPADSALGRQCTVCHTALGAPRMAVQHAVVGNCLECHQLGPSHLVVPDTACARCHRPLAEAVTLSRSDVAAFPLPPSHEREGFALGGHGPLAKVELPGGRFTVAASCATCHARNFCITCHVNAPEVQAIQALSPDERSLALSAELPKPGSHGNPAFISRHGREATREPTPCATCHTQESCTTCHIGVLPRVVTGLASRQPGRAPGAATRRAPPATHSTGFMDGEHAGEANSRPGACETCHVRPQCLDCHRPTSARGREYHPEGFLTRHPASAYGREANCSDCHNPGQFCQSCHQQAGMTAMGRLGAGGFHDTRRAFLVGHGQAARQNLESCASCHAERDCTACHSAFGAGFRFNPHGPGFDPERLRRKNPSLCSACHGTAVPGRP